MKFDWRRLKNWRLLAAIPYVAAVFIFVAIPLILLNFLSMAIDELVNYSMSKGDIFMVRRLRNWVDGADKK